MNDIYSFSPEILLSAGGLIFLLLQAFGGSRVSFLFTGLAIVFLLGAGYAAFLVPTGATMYFQGLWVADLLARIYKYIFLIGSLITVLLSSQYTKREDSMRNGEYYALILFATAGMMIMAGAQDLLIVFLGLELLSLSLYALAGSIRGNARSAEAAFKYFILGAFATALFLFGVALIFGAAKTTHLPAIAHMMQDNFIPSSYAVIGTMFILAGFAFKLALVPFHLWTPDVYEGSPMPVTVFMAAGAKAAAFASLTRIFLIAFERLSGSWQDPFWILAVVTMSVGNVAALVQVNIKRMLAYSSIAHAGYIMAGFFGAGKYAPGTIAFYLLSYTLMNGGVFAVVMLMAGKGEKRVSFDDFRGLANTRPMMALLMSIFLFSLAGIPPTAGFAAKFFIFSYAVENGHTALAVIGVLNSVVSVYYYLRLTVNMYMKEATPITREMDDERVPLFEKAALMICIAGTLLLGLFPVISHPP